MQKIGTVKFVQVQRESLKTMDGETRIFYTEPLQRVEKLRFTPEGIVGIGTLGEEIIDVHSESHPHSRYRGDNRISFGFLQNYERMRQRFGTHIKDGYAAESIVIDANIDVSKLDLSRRFFFQYGDTVIELKEVIPAPPCNEFSTWCLIVPQCADDVKAALQFLMNGTRGYYADLAAAGDYSVQAGDSFLME
jgi:hypothetical protein